MRGIPHPIALAAIAGIFPVTIAAQPAPTGSGTIVRHQPAEHATLSMGFHRSHSMRTMLTMSAAVVRPAEVGVVPLYDGLGNLPFTITTANPLAQRYFSQGLGFAYGFNHAGAIASFRQAQQIDPRCAMCW